MRWEVVDDSPGALVDPLFSLEIHGALREQLSELSGRLIGPSTAAEVWDCVHRVLSSMPGANSNGISFRTVIEHDSGEITVVPDNLYTGLLLAGHEVPGAVVLGNGTGEVTFPEGTYAFRDGNFMFRPNRTPERVEVTVELPLGTTEVTIDRRTAEALGTKVFRYTWWDIIKGLFYWLQSKLPFRHS